MARQITQQAVSTLLRNRVSAWQRSIYLHDWATLALLHAMPEKTPPVIETLTGTQPLEWPEADLSGRMMIGAHRFIESRIKVADGQRREMPIDDARRTELRKELQNVLGVVEQSMRT